MLGLLLRYDEVESLLLRVLVRQLDLRDLKQRFDDDEELWERHWGR